MAEMNFTLENKTAIVTGASRGIGESIARGFARQGATVVISSRKQESLERVAASINADGPGKAIPIACHTGHGDAIAALFDQVASKLGRLDILVNNAATNPYFGPALEIGESAYDKTMEVNLKGYFLMCQRAGRMMVVQGAGSIINISSIAGLAGSPDQVVYGMTKAAVINMTKGFARELGPAGIRVNAIAPGVTKTKFAGALFENPEIYEALMGMTPLGRHAVPGELVGAALYLASDASSYTTGSVIVCDGGLTA
ncbi:MAG: glucose 1-dehydrogenase [bacterium]|nr:glucose 1-dehydrogenase [bacterium]